MAAESPSLLSFRNDGQTFAILLCELIPRRNLQTLSAHLTGHFPHREQECPAELLEAYTESYPYMHKGAAKDDRIAGSDSAHAQVARLPGALQVQLRESARLVA